MQECECPSKLDRKLYHIEQENRQCSATTNTECSCVSTQQQQNCVPINSDSSEINRNSQLITVPIITTECNCVSKLCEPYHRFIPVNTDPEFYNSVLNVPTIDTKCSCVSKQQNQLLNCVPIESVSQSPSGVNYNYPQKQFSPTIDTNTNYGCVLKQQSNYDHMDNTSQYGIYSNPQVLNIPTSTEGGCVPKQQQVNCVPANSASQYAGTYYNYNNPQFTNVPHQQNVVGQLMGHPNCLVPQNVFYQKM